MSEKKKRPDSKRRRKMAKKNIILSIIIAVSAILIIGIAIFFFKKDSEETQKTLATESIDLENGKAQDISIEMGKIDKSWLKKAIKSAESVEKKEYTDASYQKMYENLKKAKKVRRSLFAKEEEISDAFFDLLTSMEKLEVKKK